MWLILTVLCAVLTYVSVLYFDSMVPAIIFLAATWNRRKGRE